MKLTTASKTGLLLLTFALIAFACPVRTEAASFQGLGSLPGGDSESYPYDVSPDGSVVVGVSYSASWTEAFRWTADGGMVGLGYLPSDCFQTIAHGVSADGSVVVGYGSSYASSYGLYDEAFRWTDGGGMIGLNDPPGGEFDSIAYGVSADGSVVVGQASGEAFRWTAGGGMVGLGCPPGGYFESVAHGVSADGSVVVGYGTSALDHEAFRWTADGGTVGLGYLPTGNFDSYARGVSADGSVVVGMSDSSFGDEAFRWTADGGMVGLGYLPDGNFFSDAKDVSADGSVVVGYGYWFLPDGGGAFTYQAFIWDAANGMRNLHDVLVDDCGLDLTGWMLMSAEAISDDGRTIVGSGIDPDGNYVAWIATIPEPATVLLVALGGALTFLRRRRS